MFPESFLESVRCLYEYSNKSDELIFIITIIKKSSMMKSKYIGEIMLWTPEERAYIEFYALFRFFEGFIK